MLGVFCSEIKQKSYYQYNSEPLKASDRNPILNSLRGKSPTWLRSPKAQLGLNKPGPYGMLQALLPQVY